MLLLPLSELETVSLEVEGLIHRAVFEIESFSAKCDGSTDDAGSYHLPLGMKSSADLSGLTPYFSHSLSASQGS